jgi:cobalamin biosynthetic protein CobC
MAGSLAEDIDSRFFAHGGRLDVARRLYPDAPEPWLDLSTGISPWTYPAPALASQDIHPLPSETGLLDLASAARQAYGAPQSASIVPMPGTDAGLSVLPWLFREPKRVAVLSPSYSGHASAWRAAGHSVSEIPSLGQAGNAAILIAVNPNNPDGRFTPLAALAGTLPNLKRRDGLLVIDEAFADAEETHSILPEASRLDYTLVLRSAGKFYGAGGVRLGFAITSHPVAERLKAAFGAWPLSSQAVAFGQAALKDLAWAQEQRTRLKHAAAGLDSVLTESGLSILGGTGLYRLAGHPQSHEIFVRLARAGILTRPFRDRNALRFGLPGSPADLDRVRGALLTSGRN